MTKSFTILLITVLTTLAVSAGAREASAAGNWTWGPPGFSNGWSAEARDNWVVTHGLADPLYNYYTPFWQGGSAPNYYTGIYDTGFRNTFSVNHDINANHGIPFLGYLDIVTPLLGTNELEIAASIASLWNNIASVVSSVWNSLTSMFQSDYTNYENSGSFSDPGFQDDAFFDSYDFSSGGGGYCDLCSLD